MDEGRPVTRLGDPHVVALRYRVEHSEGVTFGDDPCPIEREFESFWLRVTPNTATAHMKKHYSTQDEAREVVKGFLRSWEILEAVRNKGTGLRFIFKEAEIIDRNTPPVSATVIAVPGPRVTVRVHHELQFPDLPVTFALSEDVEVMWKLYEGYLQGRDRLLPMAYTCLTRLKYTARGNRQEAAKMYGISRNVLSKLSDLSTSGHGVNARKWSPGKPPRALMQPERDWVESAVRLLIFRAGQYAFDPTREWEEITMANLPKL